MAYTKQRPGRVDAFVLCNFFLSVCPSWFPTEDKSWRKPWSQLCHHLFISLFFGVLLTLCLSRACRVEGQTCTRAQKERNGQTEYPHLHRHNVTHQAHAQYGERFAWGFPSASGQLYFDGWRVLGGYGVGAAALFEGAGGEMVGAGRCVVKDSAVQLDHRGLWGHGGVAVVCWPVATVEQNQETLVELEEDTEDETMNAEFAWQTSTAGRQMSFYRVGKVRGHLLNTHPLLH